MNKMSTALFIVSMLIFSTIGIVVFPMQMPSAMIVFFRALIGTLFLLLVLFATKRKIDKSAIRKNLFPLVVSGIALGLNWVFLFDAYHKTGVAISTLCYYTSPAMVIFLSPLFLRTRASRVKKLCALISLSGMVFVSGVFTSSDKPDLTGIIFALIAALLYALIVIMNKKIKRLSGVETTLVQLGIATVVMAVYTFVFVPTSSYYYIIDEFSPILLLGLVHTGLAYLIYFSAIKRISVSNAALLSFIDPAGALVLSYTVLHETFTWWGALGIALILGSMILPPLLSLKRN